MRKIRFNLITCAAILIVAAHALHAQTVSDEPRNEIEVRGPYLSLSGETRFSTPQVAGTIISFSEDFDVPGSFDVDLSYTYRSRSDKHKVAVNYSRGSFEATRTLTRTIVFQGQTYPVNLAVRANLKLDDFRVMYAYRWGNEKIRVGPMVDAGFVKTRVGLDASLNNSSIAREGDTTKPALTVGYDLDYHPSPKVNIFHTLGGIAAGGDRLFRAEAGVKYFPVRNFGLSGGYAYAYYKETEDDNFVLFKPRGPFFGAVIRF